MKEIKPVLQKLKKHYPQAKCALVFKTPFQLAVATILSAQCTDKRVNMVTKDLFKKYKNLSSFSKLKSNQLGKKIYSVGFYKNKSKNIIKLSKILMEKYKGKIPKTIEALIKLPGIGRKTANVILANAFGIPGIAVDTHVGRLSMRLGLVKEKDPVKIEFALMKIIPKKDWGLFSHLLIAHGREICSSQKPKCEKCFLVKECNYYKKLI